MPAATNKTELLDVMALEYDNLIKTLDTIDTHTALQGDEASIKDTIAHRCHWIGLYLGWYAGGVAGKDVQTPASGYKWNQLKAYNAILRAQSKNTPWDTVLVEFKAAHSRLLNMLQSQDDATLYTKKLYPWMNNWTLGRWAEASGSSHYRSANKYIRKILRGLK